MWTFSGWSPDHVTCRIRTLHLRELDLDAVAGLHGYVYVCLRHQRTHAAGQRVVKAPGVHNRRGRRRISPPDSFRSYHMVEGPGAFTVGIFRSQTVAGGNLTFVGEWRWHWNSVVITPSPTATQRPPQPNHRDHARTYAATFLA
jgi:hypothetical protein